MALLPGPSDKGAAGIGWILFEYTYVRVCILDVA